MAKKKSVEIKVESKSKVEDKGQDSNVSTNSNSKFKSISKIIVGVDEAGRGPVLGPLVIAALAVKEENQKKLEWLGVKDSKLLSSEVREQLFDRIRELVEDFRVEMIEPDAIDLSLAESNLNWLEADTAARMVSEMKCDKVILDCPSPNIPAYTNYFKAKLSDDIRGKVELVVEHKADFNHIVVGAASIVAKVIRDRQIDGIKSKIKIDFGSGYPSDPKTKEFLDKYYDQYPELFRKSWMSYKDALARKQQKSLGDF